MDGSWIIIYGLLTAVLVGFAKAGIPGSGILAVPLMALLFAGKSSVGALLPILIVGDVIGVYRYHKKAVWSDIRPVFTWVAVGMVLGAALLNVISSEAFRPFLGGLMLALLLLDFLRAALKWNHMPHNIFFIIVMGVLTGTATVLGNAAGPVMTIYLLARGQEKFQFVGSMAWMFLVINLLKVPLYASMGLITVESLSFNLKIVPGVLLGAVIGIRLLPHINQAWFKRIVLIMAALASVRLLFS